MRGLLLRIPHIVHISPELPSQTQRRACYHAVSVGPAMRVRVRLVGVRVFGGRPLTREGRWGSR